MLMAEPRMQTDIVGRRTVAYSTYERAKSEAAVYKAATEALEAEVETIKAAWYEDPKQQALGVAQDALEDLAASPYEPTAKHAQDALAQFNAILDGDAG